MADSALTRWALAEALKELLREQPLQKISVSDICARCRMNRKSFYYHFRDKYDLVNSIFDGELLPLLQQEWERSGDRWALLGTICRYFYDNRSFYSKVFPVKGQNCFSEHFRQMLQRGIARALGGEEAEPMWAAFFSDGMICAIERWVLQKDPVPPEEFTRSLQALVEGSALYIARELQNNEALRE